jgi:hypothetical protein
MRVTFGQLIGVGIVLIGALQIAATALPGGRIESFFDRLSFFANPERTARQRANRRSSPRTVIGVGVVIIACGILVFLLGR